MVEARFGGDGAETVVVDLRQRRRESGEGGVSRVMAVSRGNEEGGDHGTKNVIDQTSPLLNLQINDYIGCY